MNPRHPVARRLRLALACVCLLLSGRGLVGAEATRSSFLLPGGDAALTLRQLSRQARESVVFPIELVHGVQTHPVQGEFTAREAAERMTAGTDLFVSQDIQTGALTISRRPSPELASPKPALLNQKNSPPVKKSTLITLLAGWFAATPSSHAQAAAPGSVIGRIFNPSTGEYVRNAQVRNEATGAVTISEGSGEYRISPAGPGPVTLTVTYSGYRTATATLTVGAGETISRDFNIVSTLQALGSDGEVIKLGQFVVSSEREGSAKAIMEQRQSMNVINSIASDTFGDNAEGNVGEFLRHVPGVELDQFYGEVRNVRLRGMNAEYTSVTIDGMTFASADAFGGGFTMELASMNSVEAIEVSKTVSADVDANAPAGTVNLKTKRAFDRAGRRVSAQANLVMHSQEVTLKKTAGPNDDHDSYKLRPGGIFEYSDIFFNKRLGVVLNVSESNVYQQALVSVFTYNRTPTVADPRPQVITAINFQDRPRFNKRFSTTLTADFRATPRLSLSLGLVYNYADLWMIPRNLTFNTGARTTVIGEDPLVRFTTNTPAANVLSESIGNSKLGKTITVLPKFEYRVGDWLLEGRMSHSDSVSWYDPLTRRGTIRDGSAVATGVNFTAERSSTSAADWKITQISGPDIALGSSFPNRGVNLNDGRRTRVLQIEGEVVGTLKTNRIFPVVWKTGVKNRYERRTSQDERTLKSATFVDSIGSSANWLNYDSRYDVDLGMTDGGVTSISGSKPFVLDLAKLGQAYRDRPGDFRFNFTPANYYTANIASPRRYEEEVRAGYVMGTANVSRRATVRAGLRWEGTETDATEMNTRTPAEVRAAGFPVAAGRATTIPGMDYQFLSLPRVHRTGSYDNFFPSGSFKYQFTPNLNLHLGYSSTIRRPRVFGLWTINDETQRVSAPNANLKPETSENYAARLAYYFEPVGQLSISLFENRVQDIFISEELTAEEFGYEGTDLANYLFVTTNNGDSRVKIRGMEFEYSQSLSFLGEKFKRLTARASYTRNYAEIPKPQLTPHAVSSGLNYTLGRFSGNVNLNWVDNVPTNVSGQNYRRHRTNLDAGAGWRFGQNFSFNVSARNLLNTAYITMAKVGENPAVITNHEITGITYTFALKATF